MSTPDTISVVADFHIECAKLAVVEHVLNFAHGEIGPKATPDDVCDLIWGCSLLLREIVPSLFELKDSVEKLGLKRG